MRGVGLWAPLAHWVSAGRAAATAAAELDALGFESLWLGNGARLFEQVGELLAATRRIAVATGTAHLATHPPAAIAAANARLSGAFGDRFVLSLGGAWAPDSGRPGANGYQRMLDLLDALDAGWPPVPRQRRLLAALGPRMLALARQRGAGAHPYTVPVEHTRMARQILGEGLGLVPEIKVVLEAQPDRARAIARRTLSFYLAKGNYSANLARLGFARAELTGGGSDRVVDALVGWGDVAAVRARIAAHLEAGADQVAVQLLVAEPDGLPREGYARLAEALR